MKNPNGALYSIVLLSLLLCSAPVVAQTNTYGYATNNFQTISNNFESMQIGPSRPGSGYLGAAYMGTSELPVSGFMPAIYTPVSPPLASAGPVGIYPHLLYSFVYGNGIQSRPGVNPTIMINTVAPGVFFKIGSHWNLDYTPSLMFYSSSLFHNTTDQSVRLEGLATNGAWTFVFTQSYLDTTQPTIETGTQLGQTAYATALNATWQMGSRTSLQLGLNQDIRLETGEGLANLYGWSTADWFNYQIIRGITASLGVTGGYDHMSLGSDMPYEEGLGKLTFQPGDKLSVTVSGGFEDRQFIHPSAPPLQGPIFQASALYQVLPGTLLSLIGSRTIVPSLEANQVNTFTTVSGSIRQHIVGKLFFKADAGYTVEPFSEIVPGPVPPGYFGKPTRTDLVETRNDTRTFEEFSLSTTFRTRLTGSVFFRLIQNHSSQAFFSLSGNQVGVEVIYRF